MGTAPILRLLLFTALLLVPQAARAAASPMAGVLAASAPAKAANDAPTLTPAEAAQLTAVLNDPARRAAFATTLNNLIKAERATRPAAIPAGLPPNSLGAEIILAVDALGHGFTLQGRQYAHALHDFRSFTPWFDSVTRTPEERDAVEDALWRLAAVLVLALAAVAAANVAIRRSVRALGRMAATRPPPPADPDHDPDADDPDGDATDRDATGGLPAVPPLAPALRVRKRHEVGLARMLHALRRVPFALLHLVLELAPVTGFALTVFLCEAAGLVRAGESFVVVHAAINSFVVAGIAIAAIGALLSPHQPTLRLLLLSDPVALRVAFWLRLMALVAAWGFAVIQVLQSLGLDADTASALLKTLAFVEHTLLAILFLRVRRQAARRMRPSRRVRGGTRELLRRLADGWWVAAIFFDYAFWLVWAAQLPNGYERLWTFTVRTVVVVLAARLLATALLGQLERAFRTDEAAARRHPWIASRLERYYPILRRSAGGLVALATMLALFQLWGLHAFSWFRQGALGSRVATAAVGIAAALAVSVAVWEAVNAGLERHVARLAQDGENPVRVARLRTLLPMLRITLMIFIVTVLTLTVLSEIGVNIAPLLGGAGIIGVAIGFGSQKLVQDFITGIFLLLENTMQVGDWVTLAGVSGTVEHLSIRTIRLRAGDGSLHTIPFSSVTTVNNTNRGLGNAAVSVDIAPSEDTDRAAAILKRVAVEMAADEDFRAGMLSDLQFWGVTAVTGQAVTLQGQIVCTDKTRWAVQREFNRRMRMQFQDEGIELAAPTQNVVLSPRQGHAEPRPVGGGEESAADVENSPPPAALGHGA